MKRWRLAALLPVLAALPGCQPETAPPTAAAPGGPQLGAEVAFRTAEPLNLLAWSPDGERLLYLAGNTLSEWPTGRSLALPAEFQEWNFERPLSWTLKWKPDGRQFVLHHHRAHALVVDVGAFRMTRMLEAAAAVWWEGEELCVAEPVNGAEFTPDSRHPFTRGAQRLHGPPGLMLTGVAADGGAYTAYVAGQPPEGGWRFKNVVLVRGSPADQQSAWRREILPEPGPVLEFTSVDSLAWNQRLQAAAIVMAGATDGFSACRLSLVVGERVYEPDLEEWMYIYIFSPPTWLGDRVLATLALVNDHGEWREDGAALVLLDPADGSTRVLLEGEFPGIELAAGSADGRRLAAAVRLEDGWEVRVSPAPP